jgi:hypothetical protein
MHRLIWLPAIALAACGSSDYQRPRTIEYVVQTVLAPNCGNAQCHSSFRNVANFTFDTVERARETLTGGLVGAISLNAQNEPVGDPEGALLVNVLTRAVDRMPYDQPLPQPEIDLIKDWIEFGADGAQCNPETEGNRICVGDKAVECLSDFNYGAVLDDCGAQNMNCSAGVCR